MCRAGAVGAGCVPADGGAAGAHRSQPQGLHEHHRGLRAGRVLDSGLGEGAGTLRGPAGEKPAAGREHLRGRDHLAARPALAVRAWTHERAAEEQLAAEHAVVRRCDTCLQARTPLGACPLGARGGAAQRREGLGRHVLQRPLGLQGGRLVVRSRGMAGSAGAVLRGHAQAGPDAQRGGLRRRHGQLPSPALGARRAAARGDARLGPRARHAPLHQRGRSLPPCQGMGRSPAARAEHGGGERREGRDDVQRADLGAGARGRVAAGPQDLLLAAALRGRAPQHGHLQCRHQPLPDRGQLVPGTEPVVRDAAGTRHARLGHLHRPAPGLRGLRALGLVAAAAGHPLQPGRPQERRHLQRGDQRMPPQQEVGHGAALAQGHAGGGYPREPADVHVCGAGLRGGRPF
mmetsp:Transcript_92953/g.277409  ORF Transcript_92953/g.277409 Transcript_92953/m.277409 type:complete len:403 (-) Transcript_92953:122-1330(-)